MAPGPDGVTRRQALVVGAAAFAGLGGGVAFWRAQSESTGGSGPPTGPYGRLLAPDEHGVMLPEGFRSRVVAQGREVVAGTGYRWHDFSDGAATFLTPDGGWLLASNSEADAGGVSVLRFGADGQIGDAYRILEGTSTNCSGGKTPWGSWLSCEETEEGLVWECDPTGATPARPLPALGRFKHEAAAVDPEGHAVYLTEDQPDGGLYRFLADAYPDLSRGRLEVAVADSATVRWRTVPEPGGGSAMPTRMQVPGMMRFDRGEGLCFADGTVYIATTGDSRIHAYDTRSAQMRVLHHGVPSLSAPDNLTTTPTGDLLVATDDGSDPLDLGVIAVDGRVGPFLRFTGPEHGHGNSISEVTGPAFDPSGTRLYVGSQRARRFGRIFEVTGPFENAVEAMRPPVPLVGVEFPHRRLPGARALPVALTLDAPARIRVLVGAEPVVDRRCARGAHRLRAPLPGQGPGPTDVEIEITAGRHTGRVQRTLS